MDSFVSGAVTAARGGQPLRLLLRIELDDELFLHRRVDLATLGMTQDLRRQSVVICL